MGYKRYVFVRPMSGSCSRLANSNDDDPVTMIFNSGISSCSIFKLIPILGMFCASSMQSIVLVLMSSCIVFKSRDENISLYINWSAFT